MPVREAELYKDKIEVSLDGRQIFYLFFGGAVIVGLVFVLGVMVGRRVEARGHVDRAKTTATTDPLAALDRLEANGLSFHGALTGASATSEVERKIAEIEKARGTSVSSDASKPAAIAKPKTDAPAPALAPAAAPGDDKPKTDGAKAKADDAKAKADDTAAKPKTETGKANADDAKIKTADAKPKTDDAKAKADAAKAVASDAPITKPSQIESKAKPEAKAEADAPKKKYTLQLSSFQDKQEANAFLAQLKSAGHAAYVTEAQVSGKTYYRVRVGTYGSLEAANEAKTKYETQSSKSASVMRL